MLVLAATPISLADASPRLLAEFRSADVVAEDTRRFARLLDRLAVRTDARVVSYFDGNETRRTASLVDELAAGRRVLLVTDAGMPSVSDPGYRLVTAAIERGFPVTACQGHQRSSWHRPCPACRSTGSASRVSFPARAGNAPIGRAGRRTTNDGVLRGTSPYGGRLAAMVECFGEDRRGAVCRELTKTHEEIRRGSSPDWRRGPESSEVRGEVVLVVAGTGPAAADLSSGVAEVRALVRGGTRLKQAVTTVAQASGLAKNVLYEEALKSDRQRLG